MIVFNYWLLLLILPIPILYKIVDILRFKEDVYRDNEDNVQADKYSLYWHLVAAIMNLVYVAIVLIFINFPYYGWLAGFVTIARISMDLMWNIGNGVSIWYAGDGKGAILEITEKYLANKLTHLLFRYTGLITMQTIHWIGKVIMIILSVISYIYI